MRASFTTLLLLVALAGGLQAQERVVAPPADGQGQEPAKAAPPAEPTVTVNFRGGTLAEFVAEVGRASPNVNIVAAEQCREVRLPAIALKDARVGDALEAVAVVAPQEFQVRTQQGGGGKAGQWVYAVAVALRKQAPSQADTYMRVFSLRQLTTRRPDDRVEVALKAETVLSAIDVGMQGQARAPEIRYHAESGLLFVTASPMQINVVDEVLSNLERDQRALRSHANPGASSGVGGEPSKAAEPKPKEPSQPK